MTKALEMLGLTTVVIGACVGVKYVSDKFKEVDDRLEDLENSLMFIDLEAQEFGPQEKAPDSDDSSSSSFISEDE